MASTAITGPSAKTAATDCHRSARALASLQATWQRLLQKALALSIGVGLALLATAAFALAPHGTPAPVPAASAASAARGAATTGTRSAQKGSKGADPLLVSGLATILERPRLQYFGDGDTCADFSVRHLATTPVDVQVGTSGLPGATLEVLGSRTPACSTVGAMLTTVVLKDVGPQEQRVRLRIPDSAFPSKASGAKGKVLFYRDGLSVVEQTVQLSREEYSPVLKASFWFIGILIPVLVTSTLGYWVYRLQKSHDANLVERAGWSGFRESSSSRLTELFKEDGLYETIFTTHPKGWGVRIKKELSDCGLWAAIPCKDRDALEVALREEDRPKLEHVLARHLLRHKPN